MNKLKKLSFLSTGSYEISNAEGVQPGTKIIIHLRTDCREFSDDKTINGWLLSGCTSARLGIRLHLENLMCCSWNTVFYFCEISRSSIDHLSEKSIDQVKKFNAGFMVPVRRN